VSGRETAIRGFCGEGEGLLWTGREVSEMDDHAMKVLVVIGPNLSVETKF
jgi:hypothetical protein